MSSPTRGTVFDVAQLADIEHRLALTNEISSEDAWWLIGQVKRTEHWRRCEIHAADTAYLRAHWRADQPSDEGR